MCFVPWPRPKPVSTVKIQNRQLSVQRHSSWSILASNHSWNVHNKSYSLTRAVFQKVIQKFHNVRWRFMVYQGRPQKPEINAECHCTAHAASWCGKEILSYLPPYSKIRSRNNWATVDGILLVDRASSHINFLEYLIHENKTIIVLLLFKHLTYW